MADKDDMQRLVPDWQFTDDHEYVAQELLESVGPGITPHQLKKK